MSIIAYVCPLCKEPLEEQQDAYRCSRHRRVFRVTLGIPDFRVFPDPYISFEDEDRKTARIVAEYPIRTFAELLEFYYSITPEVPRDLALKYMRNVFSGVDRGRAALAAVQAETGPAKGDAVLEIGCGTGGFLVAAAGAYPQVFGVDIALRWLIIARKRLEEAGQPATLVCACAEQLPFPDGAFGLITGSNVVEHSAGQLELLREAWRTLAPEGVLFLAMPNRWGLMPEPHVNVWGVGFLPFAWRDPYVQMARHIPYQHIRTLNYFDLRRLMRRTGFKCWYVRLPAFEPGHAARLGRWEQAVVPVYHIVRRVPVVNWLFYLFGPVFHVICYRT
jgi:SAM-dependent methyltransferase